MKIDDHWGHQRAIFPLFFNRKEKMPADLISRQSRFSLETRKCDLFSSPCSVCIIYLLLERDTLIFAELCLQRIENSPKLSLRTEKETGFLPSMADSPSITPRRERRLRSVFTAST